MIAETTSISSSQSNSITKRKEFLQALRIEFYCVCTLLLRIVEWLQTLLRPEISICNSSLYRIQIFVWTLQTQPLIGSIFWTQSFYWWLWATQDGYKSFGKKAFRNTFYEWKKSENMVKEIILANIFTPCLFSLFKAGEVELMKKLCKIYIFYYRFWYLGWKKQNIHLTLEHFENSNWSSSKRTYIN